MERAIDIDLLRMALGQHEILPTPEELSSLLADAELQILLGDFRQEESLRAMGWYLHAIGSSQYALETYGLPRQRSAMQVSAHIFDIALQQSETQDIDRLKYCFASQIAYLRSELTPNSLAIYRRTDLSQFRNLSLVDDYSEIALFSAVQLLGFDVSGLYDTTDALRSEIDSLTAEWELDDIRYSPFGASAYVASATRDVLSFLIYGNIDLIVRAREKLVTAITNEASTHDSISRWVAAHLLSLCDDFEKTSVWTSLPPTIPNIVKKVLTNSHPRILTLWLPQLNLLHPSTTDDASEPSPLHPDAKRIFLSTPTSGGKSLLAQLLIVSHLVTEGTSVCYIAPTRSLCREINLTIQSRLRLLKKTIVHGLPEFDLGLANFEKSPDVEVMTPERLSYLIRSDSESLLKQFGMFVFDEVHLVGEVGRGWTLEEDLSFLHWRTQTSNHRIILLSAAIGNRNHFIQWMGVGTEPPIHRHTDWRGPRRLHAIWTTNVNWNDERRVINEKAPKNRYRKEYPLHGQLHIRISHNGSTSTLATPGPIGKLIRSGQNWEEMKKNNDSTAQYRMLVPLIKFLGESGPVLIIEATKSMTVTLAKALAESQELYDPKPIQPLLDLVGERLGYEHPLHEILKSGVAYHHGSLPIDVRSAIEDAVSSERIKYLVATTTMTEGVNLPVRSVVIASLGAYGPGGVFNEYIVGPKLVNAIGRAGRATKETEGVVVLAVNNAIPTADDFQRLNPADHEMHIQSMLAMESVLEDLANFELSISTMEDAVLEVQQASIASFLKFVWFIAASLERIEIIASKETISQALQNTLGWHQLEEPNRERWLVLVQTLLARYEVTPKRLRLRWASAGTTILTANKLEELAREITLDVINNEFPDTIMSVLDILFAANRLNRLFSLPESPYSKTKIFSSRGGKNRQQIRIPDDQLLRDWIGGVDLIELATKYLTSVNDRSFRFEQLGDYINQYFEIYFPWVFGTIVRWVNQDLNEMGIERTLSPTLSAHVRYGVEDPIALQLLLDGLESRILAKRIASNWRLSGTALTPHQWIRQMSIIEWQSTLGASLIDLRSLLSYARDRQAHLGATLINGGVASLVVDSLYIDYPETKVRLEKEDKGELAPFQIWDDEKILGRINSSDQAEIADILRMGYQLEILFQSNKSQGDLRFQVIDP